MIWLQIFGYILLFWVVVSVIRVAILVLRWKKPLSVTIVHVFELGSIVKSLKRDREWLRRRLS